MPHLADRRQQRVDETLGRHRVVGLAGEDLGLDVEVDARGPVFVDQLEQGCQRRNALAVARRLVRELLAVGAFGVAAPHVERLHLRQCQRLDQRPALLEPLALRIAGDGLEQRRLVRDYRDAIGCDGDVQFQRADPDLQRPLEGCQRVLRRQAAGAAMALQIKGHPQGRPQSDHQRAAGGPAVAIATM